jgi:hypothetical protein
MFCRFFYPSHFPAISDVGPVPAHQNSALSFLLSGAEPWLKKLLV